MIHSILTNPTYTGAVSYTHLDVYKRQVLSFVEGIGVIKSYNLLGEKSEELSGNFKRSRNTSLDCERKMTPWTMGLNILYGIGIAAIFGQMCIRDS